MLTILQDNFASYKLEEENAKKMKYERSKAIQEEQKAQIQMKKDLQKRIAEED